MSSKSKMPINENTTSLYYITTILKIILALIPPIIGLLWISKLKKEYCLCSENWMRDYRNFYYIFIITYTFIMLIYSFVYGQKLNIFIMLFIILFNITSYFIIIYYINMLKYYNCNCSESIKSEILYIWYIIQVIFTILALPIIFLTLYNLYK